MAHEHLIQIDAGTFTEPLVSLSETIALKVQREGKTRINAPGYVLEDLFVQLRFGQQAFIYILYVSSDDRRQNDCGWTMQASIFSLSAVRTLIDCLYNVTLILENPEENGRRFRVSGLKKMLLNLAEDKQKYGGDPAWQKDLSRRRQLAEEVAMDIGITVDEVLADKCRWDTLGRYLGNSYNTSNDHQQFLRTLTLGSWGQYSALAHATFDGMFPHLAYFARDLMPQSQRHLVKDNFLPYLTMHIGRAAGVLLATLTEVQAKMRFDADGTARINTRIQEVWKALLPFVELQELYTVRYEQLMRDSGVLPLL